MPSPYDKILLKDGIAICAIYEPHPFSTKAINSALKQSGFNQIKSTGITDDKWCWVFYDWIANPIGISDKKPDGKTVEILLVEHGFASQNICDYLNEIPKVEINNG